MVIETKPNSLFVDDFAVRQKLNSRAELNIFVIPDVARRDGRLIQIDYDLESIVTGGDPIRTSDGGSEGRASDSTGATFPE